MTIFNPMPWLGGQKQLPEACMQQARSDGYTLIHHNELMMDGVTRSRWGDRLVHRISLVMVMSSAMTIFSLGIGGSWQNYPGGAAIAQPLPTDASPVNYPPGLCYQGQNDISGSWVNDGTGQLVPLQTLCEVAIQHQEDTRIPPEETDFWQAFRTAASSEAMAFADNAGVENVTTYGRTICPSLVEVGTMGELRSLQARGGLPASFDAAVNVAAIHTYCPEKTSSIGR